MSSQIPKSNQADIEIAEKFSQLVERSGISRKELSGLIKCSLSNVNRKLNGSRKLSAGEMVELLVILEIVVNVEELFNLIECVAAMNKIGLKINPKSLILFLTRR